MVDASVDGGFREKWRRAAEEFGLLPVAAGGGLVFQQKISVTAATTLIVPLTGFSRYLARLRVVTAANADINLRVSTDGGSSFDSGLNDYVQTQGRWGGSFIITNTSSETRMLIFDNYSLAGSTFPALADISVDFLGDGTTHGVLKSDTHGRDFVSNQQVRSFVSCRREALLPISHLQVFSGDNPGALFTGVVDLYGYADS